MRQNLCPEVKKNGDEEVDDELGAAGDDLGSIS
jgi:hypothetical protein